MVSLLGLKGHGPDFFLPNLISSFDVSYTAGVLLHYLRCDTDSFVVKKSRTKECNKLEGYRVCVCVVYFPICPIINCSGVCNKIRLKICFSTKCFAFLCSRGVAGKQILGGPDR